MKLYLLILTLLLSVNITFAEGSKTITVIPQRTGTAAGDTDINRIPIAIQLEIEYYPSKRIIEIITDEKLEAELYLLDISGNIIDYSPSLNALLTVDNSGYIFYLRIEGNGWRAVERLDLE